MPDRVKVFRTGGINSGAQELDAKHVRFEDRVNALKLERPKEKKNPQEDRTELGFPDNLIQQQIARLRVHYLSEPELKKLHPDTRKSEIQRSIYRYWDEATAALPDQPDLKGWVRQRIDQALES